MSVQHPKECYAGPVVIEPARVIQEREQAGLAPTCQVPASAIVVYDARLWEWVCSMPDRRECDGWLSGAWLLPRGDSNVLVMKAAGFGAPTAVMTLEELIASGVTTLVSLGSAGGLQADLGIGDVVICDRAIRDEGTSHHYLPAARFAHACPDLTAKLESAVRSRGLPARRASSWTTDALYRETTEDLNRYREEGIATVEMEAAALFAVAAYRGVSVSSIFTISDLVSEDGWHQRYHSEEKQARMIDIFETALDAIAPSGKQEPGPEIG